MGTYETYVRGKLWELMRTYANLWEQTPFYIISIFMSDLYSYIQAVIWANKNYNFSSYSKV